MLQVNQFTYNGLRSYDDMGLIITETPPIVIAERDISFESIPGRSGDIIADNGRYKNVEKSYKVEVIAGEDLSAMAQNIAVWLQGKAGYGVLTDTYDPAYYRYACYTGAISIEDKVRLLGAATLKFNCKPFKYSFAGQEPILLTKAGAVTNPEAYESTPYIKITATGDVTLSIGNTSFYIQNIEEYIEIDGELMAAYKGTALQNQKIGFVDFPRLDPGKNDISWVGSVSSVEIVPRWCAI